MVKRRREITIETHEIWIIRNEANHRYTGPAEDTDPDQSAIPTNLIDTITSSREVLKSRYPKTTRQEKRDMRVNNRIFRNIFTSILFLTAASVSIAAQAVTPQCAGEPAQYRQSIVTYLTGERPAAVFDSECSLFTKPDGTVVCRTRLRGTLYRPLESAAQYPALIMNHGSGAFFEANTMFCQIANWFAPRGYMVFVPFRRGQGDDDGPTDRSSGVYVEDMVTDFVNGGGQYTHDTPCQTNQGKCYRVQLLTEQADEDVQAAINYLKSRDDVKREWHFDNGIVIDRYNIGILGNSYGGAVTVLTNRIRRDHQAVVAFSPGAQQFADQNCARNDASCQTPMQVALMDAARNAKRPAYYLQAKWDYDTRPTIDLAYEHAYGSPDPKHSRGWMAQIFPYQNPCTELTCDYQSIHEGFIRDPAVWGISVLNFLKRNGVK